jgi:thymidylate synthase ThyX
MANPIETIYALWTLARTHESVPTAAELAERRKIDPELDKMIEDKFLEVVTSHLPLAEMLDFVFEIQGPITLREQFVRHRVGHRFGPDVGADMILLDAIPGAIDSTFWSQSMRLLDYGQFYDKGMYYVPPDFRKDPDVNVAYQNIMQQLQEGYRVLRGLGTTVEDARQILPLATSMRISWKLNFQAMKHIFARRGCWIAQLGMWEPVLHGMIEELAKVHSAFRNLVRPPCLNHERQFERCPFPADCFARLKGEDPLPPCPIFLNNYGSLDQSVPISQRCYVRQEWNKRHWRAIHDEEKMRNLADADLRYFQFWGFDPWNPESSLPKEGVEPTIWWPNDTEAHLTCPSVENCPTFETCGNCWGCYRRQFIPTTTQFTTETP